MDVSGWLGCLNIFLLLKLSLGLDRELNCAICRAIVDEVNYKIGKVDPKKTIQVGSFRVDSKGNQDTYKKPYARSEVHLLEVFEGVCENFKDYAETTDDIGQRSVCRTKARDGKTLALKDIKINADIQKSFKHKCETLIEEYEDDMISLFRKENFPDIEKAVCVEVASQCSVQDLAVPLPKSEFDGMDDLIADAEKDDTPETADSTEEDQELMDQFLKDNAQQDFDLPSHSTKEKITDTEESKKTEL